MALLLLFLVLMPAQSARAEELSAQSMIRYEPRTGAVLASRDPDRRMLIASTTKIMTALVVLEQCGVHETVRVTEAHTALEGSSAYLMAGYSYPLEMLLYGLLLASGNDAAAALADHTAGSEEAFAALMNEKAAALGLQNTHFVNPHGLDDPDHYSSARDLALLTAAAMENETFCRIFSAKSYEAPGTEYVNHNKLLDSCEGCLGGKTGYTRAAGRTLVSCAERDGLRLICVTLSDPDDWEDHRRLYDEAFETWEYVPFPEERWASVPVISGVSPTLSVECSLPGALLRLDGTTQLFVELPRFLFAPISAGETVGALHIYQDGNAIASSELRARYAVAQDEDQALLPWKRFWKNWERRCVGDLHYRDYLV